MTGELKAAIATDLMVSATWPKIKLAGYRGSIAHGTAGDVIDDEKLSKEESQNARYGKSLRNAWYHNPICKLMYFADELATLEEKVIE